MRVTPLPRTYEDERKHYTINATPGLTFFEQERTLEVDGVEYRHFDPSRSKLAAALAKGARQFNIKEESVVLYLGASHGYTASFISDMLSCGTIYCVDIAPEVVRDLVFVCEARENMIPILANASMPEQLAPRITAADIVFQDVAQPDQIEIFLRNCEAFLVSGGTGMLALKARSIDVARNPQDIFKETKRRIDSLSGLVLIDYRELAPFEKDHAFFVVKKR